MEQGTTALLGHSFCLGQQVATPHCCGRVPSRRLHRIGSVSSLSSSPLPR